MTPRNVIILGAAGRDFHNFNVFFRDNESYKVVAFTATQIPDIADKMYPPELAGKLYPKGIPIMEEALLPDLIHKYHVDDVVFCYSDVTHEHVMHLASIALSNGASFRLLGPKDTMIKSSKPVVAVCATRTGSGKSQTTRKVAEILQAKGRKVVAIRHPMPYGDLNAQKVQRFGDLKDLDFHKCTIEEREEYEPHIVRGTIVYAGVDYGAILAQAEKEADIILWDGGNNDMSFYKPDLLITVADPLRPEHGVLYHPGETNLRMADVIVINKADTASMEEVMFTIEIAREVNPNATIVIGASPVSVTDPAKIKGAKVLIIEDGPTLTHGEMDYGAGYVAAKKYGAAEIISPLEYAVGSIADTFKKYPQTSEVLPAMGYGDKQMKELAATINKTPCDVVIIGTPIDLAKLISFNKPSVRVTYDLQEIGTPTMNDVLEKF